MLATMNRTGNRIIDCLGSEEAEALLSSAQILSLPSGKLLYPQGGPMSHVYFPVTAVMSVVVVIDAGMQVEGTMVGNEGMVGLPVFLDAEFHPYRVVAQIPGQAVQVQARAFREAVKAGGNFDRIMRRYSLYRMWCANQTGVCNALHSVEERMSRWLLMAQEGVGKEEFELTHEFVAELLGVRRQTVSLVAASLQRSGLISYRRGILRVLDRAGLEASCCECYRVMKDLYARLMP
jgi:CRP-like cAMP-binding protein